MNSTDIRVDCSFCKSQFVFPDGLIYHFMSRHCFYRPFRCRQAYCSAEFFDENAFTTHCQLQHAGIKQCCVVTDPFYENVSNHLTKLLIFLSNDSSHNLHSNLRRILRNFQRAFYAENKFVAERACRAIEIYPPVQKTAEGAPIGKNWFRKILLLKASRRIKRKYKRTKCRRLAANEKLTPTKKSSEKQQRPVASKGKRKSSENPPKQGKQCGLCLKTYAHMNNLYTHAVYHLKNEYKVQYLFKCMLCPSWSSMYLQQLRIHCTKSHDISRENIQKGVHYVDENPTYANVLKEIRQRVKQPVKNWKSTQCVGVSFIE